MRPIFLICVCLLLAQAARADEQTRNAQAALKEAGFYFGTVDGENTPETSAAIRRFQIRNGLQVTGALNQETVDSLSNSQSPAEQVPQALVTPTPAMPPPPPIPDPLPRPALQPNPGRPPHSESLAQLFRRSPYERAPLPVQQETLKRAQDKLARKGYYRAPMDGFSIQALRGAILSYQDAEGLDPSGNLDIDTLHSMRLLPGESGSGFGTSQPGPKRKVYRGIEVR